ncbi:MAG: hypothetical protein QXS85_06295 [Acidilobaceae archaeon]
MPVRCVVGDDFILEIDEDRGEISLTTEDGFVIVRVEGIRGVESKGLDVIDECWELSPREADGW